MRQLIQLILPLVCYFVIEQIFGCLWGVVAGIVMTIGAAAIGSLRGGATEWSHVLADVGIIVFFGAGDYVADTLCPSAAPAISSAILTAMVIFLLKRQGQGALRRMMDGLKPGISENPFAMYLIRNSFKRIAAWCFAATAIYAVGALTDNADASAWINDYLLIVVMLGCVATEIIVSKRNNAQYSKVEWVPLMTEDGRTVGGAPRPLVHNGSHWLHAVVHLHVVNSRGELLLQLRPKSKKIQPGRWDTAVGGHISFGEDLKKALRRETLEEIGLTDFEARLTRHYVWQCPVENEYVFVFVTKSDGPFSPRNVGEVDDLKFWTAAELAQAIGKGVLTPNIEKELNEGLLESLLTGRF